jgi:Flp pilus assembly pilin Flp
MKKNRSSGQAMTEFGLMLALVAVVVLLVLAVLSPAIGRLFRTAADSATNQDINNLGNRATQTAFALTSSSTPTKTPIGFVPSSTFTPTNTNTPIPSNTPVPSNTPINSATPIASNTSIASNTPTATLTPVPAWTWCANETYPPSSSGTPCTVTGTKLVRYGAISSWNYRTITNSSQCDNDVFGPDPIVNVGKACYYWSGTWAVTISGVSPASGSSLGATSVTITGSGLMPVATNISFDSTAATNVICASDGSSCTATTPAGSIGAVNVSATIGGQTAILTNGYTYTVPPPTITLVSPNTGSINGGTIVTISGTYFSTTSGATTFTFGGTAATSVSCSSVTTCTATTPAHISGIVNVVSTVGGQSATLTGGFTYQLIISTITPASGSTYGGTTVTITGVGFAPGATIISFGGSNGTSVNCTTTSCTVVTPVHAAGVVDVVVTVGGQTATSTGAFTYVTPPPVISNVGPTSGPAAGGTTVTVSGSGFSTTAGATTFTFGGTAAASVTCSSTIRCDVVTPAHAVGAVNVVVTVGGQSGTLTNGFTFNPVVSSVSPNFSALAGGISVTVTGAGFSTTAGATTFTFDGAAATGVSCSSTTSCTMTTPAGTAGPADVAVTVSAITATLTGGYTYNAVLTCTVTSPAVNSGKGYYFLFNTNTLGSITATWNPGSSKNSIIYIYSGNPFSANPSARPSPNNYIAASSSGNGSHTATVNNRAAGTYTVLFYMNGDNINNPKDATITYQGSSCLSATPP